MASAGAPRGAPGPRRRTERATVALALMGMALTTLAVWVVVGYLGPIVQLLYGLWGLLGLLLALLAAVGVFVAFMAFLLTGRRAEPQFEAGASVESLDTKQL